ncbi:hypothetical protein Btru_007613 [Bulinus truncatus]|nr:hypothetical protein Btru_007613 [Bulinus truncatus]
MWPFTRISGEGNAAKGFLEFYPEGELQAAAFNDPLADVIVGNVDGMDGALSGNAVTRSVSKLKDTTSDKLETKVVDIGVNAETCQEFKSEQLSDVTLKGIQKTFQYSKTPDLPYGKHQKVVPITTQSVYNKITCFQVNGSIDDHVSLTNIIPDLTGYKYLSKDVINKREVDTFQKVVRHGKKNTTYTFWATTRDQFPVRFKISGVFKYYVEYVKWESPANFTDDDFAIPNNLTCQLIQVTKSEHVAVMNPIREYIQQQDDHVHEGFERFKKEHNKQYTPDEHDYRKEIFRRNLRFINSKNRAGLNYTLAVNHLADLTVKEIKTLIGCRYSHNNHVGQKFDSKAFNKQSVPEQWNWRLIGAVTPVKDQATCGSCWSFGVTGTIEGANFLKTGNLVRLSEQQLIDCSWGFGNYGCDGGMENSTYEYILENGGITSEDQYGQYLAIEGYCKDKSVKPVVQLANFTGLPPGDLSSLKLAIFHKGPIAVGIDASQSSFHFYANGVYYDPKCGKDLSRLNHAVLAVGYGSLNGHNYWLVKNSWSTYWGNDGYILMSQKDNNCGVATAASYVDIK